VNKENLFLIPMNRYLSKVFADQMHCIEKALKNSRIFVCGLVALRIRDTAGVQIGDIK